MDFAAILTLGLAVAALAFKPGPGMMTITSRTLSQGMRACFAFMAGYNVVVVFYLTLVMVGLTFARDDLLFLSIFIKALAAAYLIWIGFKGLENPIVDVTFEKIKTERVFDNVTAAMMLTMANPLVILFYAGILPTIIDVQHMNWMDVVIIYAVILGVETTIPVAYCIPLAMTRKFFSSEALTKVNIGASIVIILVGVLIGYSALPAKDLLSVFQ